MSNEVVAFVVMAYGLLMAIDKIIDVFLKYKNRAEAPETRLRNLENEIEKIKSFLANDKIRLDEHEMGSRILQRSMLALLTHAIDGSNTEPLREAKAELERYLIER